MTIDSLFLTWYYVIELRSVINRGSRQSPTNRQRRTEQNSPTPQIQMWPLTPSSMSCSPPLLILPEGFFPGSHFSLLWWLPITSCGLRTDDESVRVAVAGFLHFSFLTAFHPLLLRLPSCPPLSTQKSDRGCSRKFCLQYFSLRALCRRQKIVLFNLLPW